MRLTKARLIDVEKRFNKFLESNPHIDKEAYGGIEAFKKYLLEDREIRQMGDDLYETIEVTDMYSHGDDFTKVTTKIEKEEK